MTQTVNKIKPKTNLKPPPLFKVIYVNDDKTSMQFVIDSVINHFNFSHPAAEKIAESVHTKGSAVVAILPYEIAEQKGVEVTLEARASNYPLQIKIEKEES